MEKSYKAEDQGHYSNVMPKMTIMQPTVVNVSNPPIRENVASQGLESEIKYTPVTKESYEGKENSFLLDDEIAHFVPVKEKKIDSFDFDNREDGK